MLQGARGYGNACLDPSRQYRPIVTRHAGELTLEYGGHFWAAPRDDPGKFGEFAAKAGTLPHHRVEDVVVCPAAASAKAVKLELGRYNVWLDACSCSQEGTKVETYA